MPDREQRHAWKREVSNRVLDPDFVLKHVAPRSGWVNKANSSEGLVSEVVRDKASKRMTLRYSFGPDLVVYGKVYSDAGMALEIHRVMVHLWREGFAAESSLSVPKPLGVVPDANLLLMERAEGVSLAELVASGPIEPALEGARRAAQWLLKFQAARIPELRGESPCEKIEILKLADAVAKACAEHPEHASLLSEMLHGLRSVAPRGNSRPTPVPMHGQFRAAHVFLQDRRATVIDVEKISLSDPAKDVARFLHVLKKTCAESGGDADRADRVAREFLDEYQKHKPVGVENLPYFRALLAMKAFAKMMKNRKLSERERSSVSEMHWAEFQAATAQGEVRSAAA